MVKLVLALFVLVFASHGMDNQMQQQYESYHEPNPSDFKLINQQISNIESAVQVLFKQSEIKKYQYLEVIIYGNEEYHNQLNGLYEKKGYYNNHVSYSKIFPGDGENIFIGWDSNLHGGAGAWKFVHNQKTIAHFEDQHLINPFMLEYYTKRIILENFSVETIHVVPLDFSPISLLGNYYDDHRPYKYVIFEINDQNYGKGLAKYFTINGNWKTYRLENYGSMKQDLANDYSGIVRSLLDTMSETHRNHAMYYGRLPASIFSGSPMNFHVRFYPLIDSNIAIPPTKELPVSMDQLANAYHEYTAQKGESNGSGFWTSPLKSNYEDDPPNFDDMDARDLSTIDRTSGSTPTHNIEINMDLQKENEDLLKKNEDLQKDYKALEYLHDEKCKKMQVL
jgi:hypothetical protein